MTEIRSRCDGARTAGDPARPDRTPDRAALRRDPSEDGHGERMAGAADSGRLRDDPRRRTRSGRAAVAATTNAGEAARAVLLTVDPREKALAARLARRMWREGRLAHRCDAALPDTPPRPATPELLPPGRMPKRGRAGSERSRIALLHAFAHIEYAAIDLAFDCAARFGAGRPRGFVDDWFAVGADEAMHFALLDRRLRVLGTHYGALPAHAGLWEAAEATRHDCAARLAVVPMALEARGLDVTPATVARFEAAGDTISARILERIYRDEIRHVAAGVRWFEAEVGAGAADRWRAIIADGFAAIVKPPFNAGARAEAGLDGYTGVATA